MLASITPLGERGRNRKWPVTVGFYLFGSLAGGAALGTIAGAAGWVLGRALHPPGVAVLAIMAAAAVGALVLDGPGRPVPSIRRQVNEDWLRQYRSWVYGVAFGLQLGIGVATVVTSASTYLVAVVAAAAATSTGGLSRAVLIGATYGLVRALPLLLTARVTTFPQLGRLHSRLSALQVPARRLTLATEVLVAVVAVGRAVTGLAR